MSSTTRLILASNSPRRQELLRQAGFDFRVFTRDFDEDFPADMPAEEVAEFLAKEKNSNYRALLKDETIITADTTVVLGNDVLNKPGDRDHAVEMIRSLSDRTHQVISGVCISSPDVTRSFHEVTDVTFHPVSDEEIRFYVDAYEPYDKAGAYGIQEWIGLTKVSKLTGSYFNVVGLPIDQVYHVLKEDFHIIPELKR